MSVLGIDIGLSGAVVRLSADGSELLNYWDMPITSDGAAGRNAINPALLYSMLKKTNADIAYVERVSSRPTDSHVTAFSFGRSSGTVAACLACTGIPIEYLSPVDWKNIIGLAKSSDRAAAKNASRAEAIRRFPSHADLFARVKDNGRSDACLIALAGILRGIHRHAA